jgi:hypothetical protein
VLQLKELGLARNLHSQKAWEELAEDPFRGLRAGPVTFSPFCFRTANSNAPGFVKSLTNLKTAPIDERRSVFIEENSKALYHESGAKQFPKC